MPKCQNSAEMPKFCRNAITLPKCHNSAEMPELDLPELPKYAKMPEFWLDKLINYINYTPLKKVSTHLTISKNNQINVVI